MSQRPIMDAGPGLNFFSVNKERLLFDTLGPLCVPEAVETEILRKARYDERFAAAGRVWRKLPERLMEVISDDATEALAAAVQRISGVPFEQRLNSGKDLGETMVIAHAAVAAAAGGHVIVLIDDGAGCRAAAHEARRLERLRSSGRSVGSIGLVHTVTVLERAAGSTYLPDRKAMRDLYARLTALDDGLPRLEATNLLSLFPVGTLRETGPRRRAQARNYSESDTDGGAVYPALDRARTGCLCGSGCVGGLERWGSRMVP